MTDYYGKLIRYAVARGARTTAEIARECGGIFPPEIESLLERLIADGHLRYKNDEYHPKAQTRSPLRQPLKLILPEPHPLDYDWRFTPETAARLTQLVLDYSRLHRRVLLLGAPTILAGLAAHTSPPQTVMLDWSDALVNFVGSQLTDALLDIQQHDLLSGTLWQPPEQVDVTLCDPPWYPEYYTAFLAQAAYTTHVGGVVLASLLSPHIRPDAIHERNHVFQEAHEMGLALEGVASGVLAYMPSTFEVNSLHTAGMDLPDDWHYGDLAIFRKFTNNPNLPDVVGDIARNGTHWHEILLGRRKIKLRGDLSDHASPQLVSIEPNDTLPTVGRGYDGRANVDLWLWDNRVFQVRGKAAIWAALHQVSGEPPPYAVDSIHLQQAMDLLHDQLNLNGNIG